MDKDYSWSTHQSMLQTILYTFKPELLVELGVGKYSTSVLLDYNFKELICIECDSDWLQFIKNSVSPKENVTFIHHDLGKEITLGTFLYQLTEEQKENIIHYYEDFSKKISEKNLQPKFLFVDNHTCCRTLAINTLYKDFDIIAYHDCEPLGIKWYEYYFKEDLEKEYDHYILKSPSSWTGCFFHKKLNITESVFINNSIPYIEEYCKKVGLDNDRIILVKE